MKLKRIPKKFEILDQVNLILLYIYLQFASLNDNNNSNEINE